MSTNTSTKTTASAKMKKQLKAVFARMIDDATWEITADGVIIGTSAMPDLSTGGVTVEIRTHHSADTMFQQPVSQEMRNMASWITFARRNGAGLLLTQDGDLTMVMPLDMEDIQPCRISELEAAVW